jgi:hypothetical protein
VYQKNSTHGTGLQEKWQSDSAQNSPDNARLEQRYQGFEQVPHLKESRRYRWMRRGQSNHAADVPDIHLPTMVAEQSGGRLA